MKYGHGILSRQERAKKVKRVIAFIMTKANSGKV